MISLYEKFLADNGKNFLSADRNIFIEYKKFLSNTVKPATGRLYLTVVKLFIKWLASVDSEITDYASDVSNIKIDSTSHAKDALTADEGRKLLASLNIKDDSEKNLRNRAMITLMITLGLRTVEITRLDVGDIVTLRGELFLQIFGKGRSGKNDFVMLPSKCHELIQDYLAVREKLHGKPTAKAPMFVSTSRSNKGQRLQATAISRIAKLALIDAGFNSPRLTAHSLRHTAATLMISSGADIAAVQKVLRHKSINTTMIYRHDLDLFSNRAVNLAVDSLFGKE